MRKPSPEPVTIGACPILDGLKEDWESEITDPWLRVVVAFADLMFRADGAPRARCVRILSPEPPYRYGKAADLSLAGVNVDAERIAGTLNRLFPFGDGNLETARVDGGRMRLQVPLHGYRKEANVLADWPTIGATGNKRHTAPNLDNLEGGDFRRIRRFEP